MTSPLRHLAALALAALSAAACGVSDDDAPYGGRPPSPTGAATVSRDAVVTLEGERFVAVRTVPANALSAEKLESVGEGQEASGETIVMARARDTRVGVDKRGRFVAKWWHDTTNEDP